MKKLLLSAALLAGFYAQAQLYSFESSEQYTAGQSVIGQNGWSTFQSTSVVSQPLAMVSTEKFTGVGSQCVKLESNGGYVQGNLGVLILSPTFANSTTQSVTANVFLEDAEDGSSDGNIYLIGENATGSLVQAAILNISYNGTLRAANFVTQQYVTLSEGFVHDQWNNYTLERNGNTVTFFINGVAIGTAPLNPTALNVKFAAFANDNYATNLFIDEYEYSTTLATQDFAANSFKVYPNPAKDEINIVANFAQRLEGVSIYDMNGRMVKSVSGTDLSGAISIAELANGIYTVEAITNAGTSTTKLVKN